MDSQTKAYFSELAKAIKANDKNAAICIAERICTCPDCNMARTRNQISQCDNARMMRDINDKIIGSSPGNYVPELSPNYEPYHSGKRRAF